MLFLLNSYINYISTIVLLKNIRKSWKNAGKMRETLPEISLLTVCEICTENFAKFGFAQKSAKCEILRNWCPLYTRVIHCIIMKEGRRMAGSGLEEGKNQSSWGQLLTDQQKAHMGMTSKSITSIPNKCSLFHFHAIFKRSPY